MKHDPKGMADLVDAIEQEIYALTYLDPHDPQIPLLQDRLVNALHELYRNVPRGV
jgi:hypothetical protein